MYAVEAPSVAARAAVRLRPVGRVERALIAIGSMPVIRFWGGQW